MEDKIIDELIAQCQEDLQNGRKFDAKRRAREALIRAELKMKPYLLEKESSGTDKMLTDGFRECCAIFKEVGEHALSVKCFYLATLFDVDWTIETHVTVSICLWVNLVQGISMAHLAIRYEEIVHLFNELDVIAKYAEERNKYELSIRIDTDVHNQQKSLLLFYGQGPRNIWDNRNKYSSLMRCSRCCFKLNAHSQVMALTDIVLKEFSKYDNTDAIELSAKSLQALGEIQKSLARCNRGLNNSKADVKERFLNLKKCLEDQLSKENDHEHHNWLKGTNAHIGKDEAKVTTSCTKPRRHRRPKSKNPSFPTPEAAKEAMSAELGIEDKNSSKRNVTRVKQKKIDHMPRQPTNFNPLEETVIVNTTEVVRNDRYEHSDTINDESNSDDNFTSINISEDGISSDDFEPDDVSIDNLEDAISLSEYESDRQEDNLAEQVDFHEQSKCLYSGEKQPTFHEEQKWVNNGMQFMHDFVNNFKPKKQFGDVYDECDNEAELLERLNSNPQKYIRCIIHHDGCHDATCIPVDKVSKCSVIHISGRSKIGRTFNNDEVVVKVLRQNNKTEVMNGKVLGILTRHRYQNIEHPVFICTVDDNGSHLLRPMCKTVPKIRIRTNKMKSEENKSTFTVYNYDERVGVLRKSKDVKVSCKENHVVFLVVFITWNSTFSYPLGAIVKILPSGNTIARGLRILNMQYEVPSLYSKESIEQVNKLHTSEGLDEPSLEKQQERRDCTNLDAFTIDPPDSKDLDDALSLECSEGQYCVGIHISDVTEYVEKDDAFDIDASKRSLTFYPEVDRPRHMLPEPLSTRKCSLLEGKRRLTLSVFYCFDTNGKLKSNHCTSQDIAETVIKSRKQFTYSQVQSIINKDASKPKINKIENDIKILSKIATALRKQRLGNAMFASKEEFDVSCAEDNVHQAHYLVEEFMILTNLTVGRILYGKYPECVPVRYQPPPSNEDMEGFLIKNGVFIDVVANLQGKQIAGSIRGIHKLLALDTESLKGKHVTVPKQLWQAIRDNPRIAKQMLMCDHMLPNQYVVHLDWFSIQESAGYVCCKGQKSDADDGKHYDLDAFPYVHFTSPIRRYIDMVAHRLLHAYLKDQPCPYTQNEIKSICIELSSKEKRAKEYSRKCQLLKRALELQKHSQMIQCYVEDVSTSGIRFCTPTLKNVTTKDRTLAFNLLEMGHKPEVLQDETGEYVKATWRKRLYDSKGTAFKYPKGTCNKICLRLNSNKNSELIPISTWAHMMKSAIDGHNADFERHLQSKTEQHSSIFPGFDDVSTESVDLEDLKPYTKFSFDFKRGQVISIQMSAGPLRGIMVPKPVCFRLTDTISFCLLHTEDPVLQLSNYSTVAVSKSYRNATQYVSEWLPLVLMESASNTVGCANDNVCINNVSINFTSGGTSGKFSLSMKHCDERNIELSGLQREEANMEDNDCVEKSFDWLCIKAPFPSHTNTPNVSNRLTDYWIAHGTITSVKQKSQKSDALIVSFRLTERSGAVPAEVATGHSQYSVEILRKTDVDCRTERFIQTLRSSSDRLPKQIAIKQRIPDLDPEYQDAVNGMTLDLHYTECTRDPTRRPMAKNNEKQQEAIDKAMRSRFTLIQGPPGTGKTNTGIKLIYLFDKINEKISTKCLQRKRVLFCGPSNKSVDLVARWMLKRMGSYAPKFVRVYGKSIEAMDFPIPGKKFYTPKNLAPANDLRCVSLHHIIRENGKPHAEEIEEFDKFFEDHNYIPMPEKVKQYKQLLHIACEEEIKEYNVILCTADVATNPRLLTTLHVQQLIMDEAGMCPEPKCLVPIIASKAQQVVLIGDHMQLRPIIKCKEAAELGMDTSLFDRYARMKKSKKLENNVNFTMLECQYRMHPRICDLPSELFYEGKLQTRRDFPREPPLPIWPQHETLGLIPRVFVHIEGKEEMFTVSTEDGNEMSKSNAEEVDYVVELYRHLIAQAPSQSVYILSQYNAQCSEIKRKLREINLYDENVSTVVSSQGGEWDYVIFSTVRSLPAYKIEKNPTLGWCKYNLGFITDRNQVNVAITRAKKGLVIVGNKNLLRCDRTWSKILEDYEHYGCVKTPQEFPPPNARLSRREIMARAQANTRRRYGDTIYERGEATSYDGQVDDTPPVRFLTRGGAARRGYLNRPS